MSPSGNSKPPERTNREDGSLIRALPGLAQSSAEAYIRGARWTVRTVAHSGARLMRAAANRHEPADLLRTTEAELQERTRRLLGIEGAPRERVLSVEDAESDRANARQTLRQRGDELLRRSADVNSGERAHPAYMRILDDLAPDEARILRLLYSRRWTSDPACSRFSRRRSWSRPAST
jgi:hypothetical protein